MFFTPKCVSEGLEEKYKRVRASIKDLSDNYDINIVPLVFQELPGAVINRTFSETKPPYKTDAESKDSILESSLESMKGFLEGYLSDARWIRQEITLSDFLKYEDFYNKYLDTSREGEFDEREFRNKPKKPDPGDIHLLMYAIYMEKTNIYDSVIVGSEDRHIRGPVYKKAIENYGIEVLGLEELIKKSEEEIGATKV